MAPCTLDTVPYEVLEHIALFCTADLLGPPSTLVDLLLTSPRINDCLSLRANPLLYARIFALKFDLDAFVRRRGEPATSESSLSSLLAEELKWRFIILKRIRSFSQEIRQFDETERSQVLWTIYIMLLENGSKGHNYAQIRDYAMLSNYLKYSYRQLYLTLLKTPSTNEDPTQWPPDKHECNSLLMWTTWLFIRSEDYLEAEGVIPYTLLLSKLFSVTAHRYPVTSRSWTSFDPPQVPKTSPIPHRPNLALSCPPISLPAILSFLSILGRGSQADIYYPDTMRITPPASHSLPLQEWDSQWARSIAPDAMCFASGSLSGTWEGLFTYMEFSIYASLLDGATPNLLTRPRSAIAKHRQTWKLKEWYLSPSADGISEQSTVLAAGDPLRGYIPTGTSFSYSSDGRTLRVVQPDYKDALVYTDRRPDGNAVDIIVTGEGHSAWGEFQLIGRIRPCDGLVSLSKEYVSGERGRWLYRGYIVGDTRGHLVGRWRDTVTDIDLDGYEGCFLMGRRIR